MAFRAAVATTTSGFSIVATMPTTVSGDYVCALITQDGGGVTYTPPAGWSQVGSSIASPGSDGQTLSYFRLDAGAPGSPPANYTWTSSSSQASQVIIASFSGRSLTERFITASTSGGTPAATPISASFTGGTASAGDDVFVIMALDKTNTDAWSFGTPTGSAGTFTLRINDAASADFLGAGLATTDAVAGGATGSTACTITRTSGTNTSGWGGWVVAVAASGGAGNDGGSSHSGIAFASATAAIYSASGGSTVAPTYPSSIAAGDLLIMIVGQKPSAANGGTCTTPAGWTLVTSLTGGNDGNTGGYGSTLTTNGDDGNINIYAYSKVAAGSETGTLSVTIGTNNVTWALMLRYTNATKLWSVAGTTGKRTTTPTSPISVTFLADPGVRKNDVVVVGFAIPTDVTTPSQFSSETLSQTGVTFGTVTEVEEPDSTTGNDIGGVVVRSTVTAGPGTAAPVWGSTLAGTLTNVRGPLVFLRIRERLVGLPQDPRRSLRSPLLCM